MPKSVLINVFFNEHEIGNLILCQAFQIILNSRGHSHVLMIIIKGGIVTENLTYYIFVDFLVLYC